MKDFRPLIVITPAKQFEHLPFNLHNFNFFRNSEHGDFLFSQNSKLFALLMAVPYILSLEVVFFRKKRFLLRLKKYVVGIFVVREKLDALYVSSLAVAPAYRGCGIATYILDYSEKLARELGKAGLELSVLKENIPARRLYAKFGFGLKEERRWSFILRKQI